MNSRGINYKECSKIYVKKFHEKIVPIVLQLAITSHKRMAKLNKTSRKHKHPISKKISMKTVPEQLPGNQ